MINYIPGPTIASGYWRCVPEWSLAGNDKYGDCAFVGLANLHDLVTAVNGAPEVMSDAEAEHFYSVEAGFIPGDASTDHGETLEKVLRYWSENGWPGDPELKPFEWHAISLAEVPDTIRRYGAAYCWFSLPAKDDEWDFSDDAVTKVIEGSGPHCMLVVDAAPDRSWVVTWGGVREVSAAWMAAYWRGGFAVQHPQWEMRP